MAYDFIRLNIAEKIAYLQLDRPPANLLHIAMLEEINDALLSLRAPATVQLVVLRGANGEFCSGFDLSEHDAARVQRLIQVFMRVFETIRMMNLISVAAVEGRALGAGFELALSCNLIVATESTEFALPQLKAGVIPAIASAVLPRIAPRRKAMEWILTGNPIPAQRLEHDGVVNHLYPESDFDAELQTFLTQITDKSGPVLQLAKRAQFEAYYATFPQALASIQMLYLKELMSLEDAIEGPKAVHEQRQPVWRHR
jgi:enoyl-CoA hydratase/carnithine racemase